MTITKYYSKLNKPERKDFINLLAEKVGVSNQTVYGWCKNKYNTPTKYKQIIDDTITLNEESKPYRQQSDKTNILHEYYNTLKYIDKSKLASMITDKLGLSVSTISNWGTGVYTPPTKYNARLKDVIEKHKQMVQYEHKTITAATSGAETHTITNQVLDKLVAIEFKSITINDINKMSFNELFSIIKILEATSIEYCNGYKYSIILRSELCSLSKYPIYIQGTNEELHFYGDRLTSLSKATLKLAEIVTDVSGLSLDNLINKYK